MDGDSPMNPGQISNQVHAIRPGWQMAGIAKAVRKACESYPPEVVLAAALAAARDARAETPGVIPARCEHEQQRMAVAARVVEVEQELPPTHCRRPGCPCEHEADVCEVGWLVVDPGTGARDEDRVRPCATCRPALAERVAEARRWREARQARLDRLATERDPATLAAILRDTRAALAARRPTPQEGKTA